MVTWASVLLAQVESGRADDGKLLHASLAEPLLPCPLVGTPREAAGASDSAFPSSVPSLGRRPGQGRLSPGPILPAMKRAAYLDDPHVCDFLDWAPPLVAGTRPFRHRWHSRKWGSWSCETLFDAFCKYEWRFKVDVPGRGECRGRSYADTVWVLDELSQQLRRSADSGDTTRFLEAAVAVVRWGGAGVKQNEG